MAILQERAYPQSADYAHGSPHLEHRRLRAFLTETVRELVLERLDHTGRCRVLEVGAGHGAFSDHILALGADLVVSEMSRPSLARLRERFRHNAHVDFVYDDDGEAVFLVPEPFDLVLCISVLHHIPDYVGWVKRLPGLLNPGAHFASFQDPLYYPRRSRVAVRADRAAFLAWRVRQGNLLTGAATQLRRFRHTYDPSCPGDMVEFHVVRQGVDEDALLSALRPVFDTVLLKTYWSTAGSLFQRLGEAAKGRNTFAITARSFSGRGATRGS